MLEAVVDALKPYSDLITAVATVVMACFTGILVWVTRQQAKLTREALITTERAFVFLEDFDSTWAFHPAALQHGTAFGTRQVPPRLTQFVIRPRWRNNGTTPTRNMRVSVNWTHFDGPLPAAFAYQCPTPTPMFLAPQATEWSEPIYIPDDVATRALSGPTRIFIWGRVDYDDIFDGTGAHFTNWCYRVLLRLNAAGEPERQFIAEGSHNGSDEDAKRT